MLEVVVSLRACVWSFDLSRWGLGRLFAATVFTVPGHWLRYRLRHEGRCYRLRYRRCYRLRYRRCYEWLRMTPAG